jgi:hypothetical protein
VTKAYTAAAIGGGVLLVAAILYLWKNGLAGAARAGVNAANDVVGGAVVGLGDAIGIPPTDMTECQKLLAAGSYWDASFKCPAGALLKGFFGDTPSSSEIPAASSPATPSGTGTSTPGAFAPAPDLTFATQ